MLEQQQHLIRNFSIIAHIDHGKSTLADRFLELTKTISTEKMEPQFLDQMALEKERGITIKLQPVNMLYQDAQSGKEYSLNLIDTPGHVDFSYEVSRSLAAVEGAILLVDARQGVQAQTIANLYLALKEKLTIIPVLNKIDLPNIDIAARRSELAQLLDIDPEDVLAVSAKTGQGVADLLKVIVQKVPAPTGQIDAPVRALIFDSFFDSYRGVVALIKLVDGKIKVDDKLTMFATNQAIDCLETGLLKPKPVSIEQLSAGQIGYVVTGLKEISICQVGDTLVDTINFQHAKPLPGYRSIEPMVFAGLYLPGEKESQKLKKALEKLKLNDASFVFKPERSSSLGIGFRCGFLGLLHLDIVRERLKREYDLDLTITAPSVAYRITLIDDQQKIIKTAEDFPSPVQIKKIEEPWLKVNLVTPQNCLGQVMSLIKQNKGEIIDTHFLFNQSNSGFSKETNNQCQVVLDLEMPLSLLLVNFYDKLKSISSGYASYSYELLGYRVAKVVKLDVLIAEEKIVPLSRIVYQDRAYAEGRMLVDQLKKNLPRQQFELKIQAVVNGKIIAAEHLSALRKDVTAKLYGGDITRKMKLLKKQKKGKKRMRQHGKAYVPTEVYVKMLTINK